MFLSVALEHTISVPFSIFHIIKEIFLRFVGILIFIFKKYRTFALLIIKRIQMKKCLFTLMLLFVTFCMSAQTNDAFKEDAQKLMSIVSKSSFEAAITPLKQLIPADKFPEAEKEIKATLPSLYDAMAKIYMEEFTHNEIKELLKFYETPLGKKMAEKTSVLSRKGMIEGTKWGQEKLTPILQKYSK